MALAARAGRPDWREWLDGIGAAAWQEWLAWAEVTAADPRHEEYRWAVLVQLAEAGLRMGKVSDLTAIAPRWGAGPERKAPGAKARAGWTRAGGGG